MEAVTTCRSPFACVQLFGGCGVQDFHATAVPTYTRVQVLMEALSQILLVLCKHKCNMDLKRLEMHFLVSTKTVRYQFVLNKWWKRGVVNEYKIKATQKSGNKIIYCHLLISE